MREKSDINKLLEGRCRDIDGKDYIGLKKANEAHSVGTASAIYDPMEDRIVDVLSMSEYYLFWLLRYDPNVAKIREQMVLDPHTVAAIALELGFNVPKSLLSTDFLVEYTDGRYVAYSVKPTRRKFNRDNYDEYTIGQWKSLIRRQTIEKKHWERFGVEFRLIFSDELNRIEALNIKACMTFYNERDVQNIDHMYRYLIAHRDVIPDMTKGYIPFAEIAHANADTIRALYEERTAERKTKR